MCGIAGIYNRKGKPFPEIIIKAMCDIQRHRGPDGDGYYFSWDSQGNYQESAARVGLGHRRLAIIDLSESGRQPMCNETGSIWITYNGEIYNYGDLKRDLLSCGHRFKSFTDTEVILHAYEEWGEDCVNRFNGMWAFAIWDENRETLFLSRDRFGIKPLYYLIDKDEFLFASEIKAILAIRPEERIPNRSYVATFLTYGLMDHGEETFFERIRSLPPGHSMKISKTGIELNQYWTLPVETDSDAKYPTQNPSKKLKEAFLELLRDSVRLRLISDAPLGSCLSGGLDSSSIVSLASKDFDALPCFSSVFEGEPCDETPFAEDIIDRCQANPHWVSPDLGEFFDVLPKIVWYQDEPGSAYGTFPQWKVMENASRHVRVLLDGQGGDELLAGYHHFLPHYLLTAENDPNLSIGDFQKIRNEINDTYGATVAPSDIMDPNEDLNYRKQILTPELMRNASLTQRHFKGPYADHLDNVLFYALKRDILPSLLHYQDRMSMAFSIESRVPFLDYRLVQFCFQMPYREKIKHGMTKAILRESMAGILPESIRNRRDKQGFPAPLSKWIRDGLGQGIQNYLFSGSLEQRGIIDIETARVRFGNHVKGDADHTWEIWRWLTLEVWYREFIDKKIQVGESQS